MKQDHIARCAEITMMLGSVLAQRGLPDDAEILRNLGAALILKPERLRYDTILRFIRRLASQEPQKIGSLLRKAHAAFPPWEGTMNSKSNDILFREFVAAAHAEMN